MLVPTFTFNLQHPVQAGLVTIGKFDGVHPAMAFATTSDTVMIHSPHTATGTTKHETRQLAVNRRITALSASPLSNQPASPDLLLIGSATNMLAYNAEMNSDVWYRDLPDGVHSAATAVTTKTNGAPIAFCGGSGSIVGIDGNGDEKLFTVTNDSVTAMATRPRLNGGGAEEVICGGADGTIRVYNHTDIVSEVSESDRVCHVTHLFGNYYAFALSNGTIGVYNGTKRLWQARSKHSCNGLTAFDLDSDGTVELVSAWSHGRLEVRKVTDGKLIYKDKFNTAIAAVIVADYRMDNKPQIIAVATDGQIRGYLPRQTDNGMSGEIRPLMDKELIESNRKELEAKRTELMNEYRTYETAVKQARAGPPSAGNNNNTDNTMNEIASGTTPANTNVSINVRANKLNQCIMLSLQTNNETIIKLVLIYCEALFEYECKVIAPSKPSGSVSVPLRMNKNIAAELQVKVVVGTRGSAIDHVFELTHSLHRFAVFVPCKPRDVPSTPEGSVTFATSERVNRTLLWLNSSFAMDTSSAPTASALNNNNNNNNTPAAAAPNLNVLVNNDSLTAAFINTRDNTPLIIRHTSDAGGRIIIQCDSMETCGDLITDLCNYMKWFNLESLCDFPLEMSNLNTIMESVDQCNLVRKKLSINMADGVSSMKMSLVSAEDSRLLGDIDTMMSRYTSVYQQNIEMINEYRKRQTNQENLLISLKLINQIIQKASRLRVGNARDKVIAECRNALKNNNALAFQKIIRTGSS